MLLPRTSCTSTAHSTCLPRLQLANAHEQCGGCSNALQCVMLWHIEVVDSAGGQCPEETG